MSAPLTAQFLIAKHQCRCGYTYWQPAGRPMPTCPICGRKPPSARRVTEWEPHTVDLTPIGI